MTRVRHAFDGRVMAMRFSHLLVLLLLGLTGYGYYRYTLEKKDADAEIARLRAEVERSQRATVPQQPERHLCSFCDGEGRVPMHRENEVTAVRRMAEARNAVRYQKCPICGGSGYRALKIPADGYICSDCKGMGKVLLSGGNAAGTCKRCNGAGWILPRHKRL